MASLDDIAEVLRVHPRTVLRALYPSKAHPYWVPGYNPNVSVESVAKAYCSGVKTVQRALKKQEALLTPVEAAKKLGMPLRTLRYRMDTSPDFAPALRGRGVVRFAASALKPVKKANGKAKGRANGEAKK